VGYAGMAGFLLEEFGKDGDGFLRILKPGVIVGPASSNDKA
jgi:hypothetical protein